MKTAIIYTIIGLLAINSLMAQVKIGDNPQNLDPASLLELESTTRALVITRVTDAQMSTINPLRGAIVYNTDQGCLHYYDGMAWINICEVLDDSFSVSTRDDYMSQLYTDTVDSTVVVTATDNGDGSINYNFEVGRINKRNIRNFSIEPNHIVNGAITNDKVASRAINPQVHFFDGATNTRQVILWDGTNWGYTLESDLQISEHQDLADVVANGSSAGNSVITDVLDPSQPLDVVNLQSLNAAITASELLDDDTDDENELLTGSGIAGGTLTMTDAGGD
ncbi:MAG: hypothetical protein NXH90_09835, partial [Flavobacteriaceae bacterium]|nr:hypothetical protein [Flavobacteriaceae bacterium]